MQASAVEQLQTNNMFNIVALTDCNRFAIDKNGQLTAVLALHTNFSDSLDHDRYNQLFNTRKQAFELLGDEFHFSIHSLRYKKEHSEKSKINDQVIRELTNKWNAQFKNSYQTKHYLIITTKNKTMLQKTVAKQQQVDINKLESLENKVNELISRLHIYNLELLVREYLISYWSSRLNARDVKVKTDTYLFDEYITDTDIFFPNKKNYFIFNHNGEELYSTFLSIKAYPSDTTNRLFHELQKTNTEFNIYQHYFVEDIAQSLKKIDERIRRLQNLSRFNETALIQLDSLQERLQNEEIKLFTQIWNIQIFAHSLEELNKKTLHIQILIERRNLLLVRESKNLESCFWSIFPTYEKYRIRKYQITSDNLAHFITFASDDQGLDRNTWGDKPVCKFMTAYNSVYNFSFHESADKEALGNTVVIGGSGV